MNIAFPNLALLGLLAALAIPPLIHFLNRRRHEVVDWGAMQFLDVSPMKRRRLMIEEFLLMALRMGLVAGLFLAFANPNVSGPLVAGWTRPPCDTVLVLDGSYSMQRTDHQAPSPWEQARQWCDQWLTRRHAGDRIAVWLAAQPPEAVVGSLSADVAGVKEALDQLPPPSGTADWPRGVADAWSLLRDSSRAARRDVVMLTDRQKLGWADPATLDQWRRFARQVQEESEKLKTTPTFAPPTLWAMTLGEARPAPNFRLAPLQAARTIAGLGQRLRFATALQWEHLASERPPTKLQVTVGDNVKDLPLPSRLEGKAGRLPLTFEQTFTTIGVHRVSARVHPEQGQDALPADDRQDLAIEVVQELPILMIDGDKQVTTESATYYLTKAFADPGDKSKVSFVVPRVVAYDAFDAEALLVRAAPAPRAVVMADVPRLTEPQLAGLTRYVEAGGGLLVFVGPRAQQEFYNEQLFREGKGVLPARLDGIESVKTDQAPGLDVKRFLHAALELFRDEPNCTLGDARYSHWWKATAPTHGQGTPVALLTNSDPWLIAKTHGQGHVLLSTLPMDRSWGGHLPKTWEFPVLAHELLFTLADVRSGGFNLRPGQTLRLNHDPTADAALPASVTLFKPTGKATTRSAAAWPFLWRHPGPPGVYHVQIAGGAKSPVVLHADPRESDLTPCTDEERNSVAEILSLRYLEEMGEPDNADAAEEKQDVWWLFLCGVIALLCVELWLTRRMAIARVRG